MSAQNINGYTQENIVDVLPADSCRPISFKPCKPQTNFNSNNNSTMNLQNANCCPTPGPFQLINLTPNALSPILFDLQSNGSTGSDRVHQNSILKFTGVGVNVEHSQTFENQNEINNIKITAVGGGSGTPYTGTGFTTVTGSTINTSLSSAVIGGTLPTNVGFVANDNKYYTSIPASMITGLVTSATETPNGTATSPTIALTLSGTANRIIKADAILSANAGNQLSNNNGLFVPAFVETSYTANAGVKKVGNNFSLDAITIPANSIPTTTLNNFPASVLTALNSGNNPSNGTYQITVAGGNASLTAPVAGGGTTYTVAFNSGLTISSSNVIGTNIPQIASLFTPVSGVAPTGVPFLFGNGNAYNSIPASAISGLPSIVNTQLVANDSNSFDFTTSGTDSHTLTGNVKISAQANNAISILNDGLFATTGGAAVIDTASLGVIKIGNDFRLNGATIPASSIPASAISGLPTFSETILSVVDSTSIDFSVSGAANHTLTGAVKISPDAGNLLTNASNGSGLYVAGATSGGSISTLSGDVTGTNVATTVAKIRGTNVSTIAPTAGQSLVFNGTDYAPTTPSSSVSAVTIAGAPSTAAANVSKFQTDTSTGATYFVDPLGVLVPLSPVLSKTIGFDTGTATTGSIAPAYVGYDIMRASSAYSKVVLETVDFIIKNDSTTAITGTIVLEVQDSSGTTIANSGSLAYPPAGTTNRTTISIPAGNRVKGQFVELTAKVISGGNTNLGINAEITGFAGK
jgi:hypothetical protein